MDKETVQDDPEQKHWQNEVIVQDDPEQLRWMLSI